MSYTFFVSDLAKEEIKKQLAKTILPSYFRVGLKSGGCNGFSYVFKIDNKIILDTDFTFLFDDLKVAIDYKSIVYLDGSTLDYENTLMNRGFVCKNPNAVSSCGCKKSFGV